MSFEIVLELSCNIVCDMLSRGIPEQAPNGTRQPDLPTLGSRKSLVKPQVVSSGAAAL